MPGDQRYIHGTGPAEQDRLRRLNRLTNGSFLEFLPVRPGQRVLELGSGLGILAGEVAARVRPGLAVGLEMSRAQIQAAQQMEGGLHVVMGDAHAPPFREETFDLVYCRFLLEHVHDPAAVLRAARQLLKPGGKICVQENTVLVNMFDPECPGFDIVWKKFVELQRELRGDAMIGKQLFRLLAVADFAGIELAIAPEVHHAGQPTYAEWIANLAGNIESAEDALLLGRYCSRDEIQRAYDELAALAANRRGSAWFYWNRATAYRPHNVEREGQQ